MPDMAMTSRERVERAINFEKPDRVPFNFWMDRRKMDELDARYGEPFRVTHFGADVIEHVMPIPFPRAVHEERSGTQWMVKEAFDSWDETAALAMPDHDDPAIYEGIEADLKRFPDRAVLADMPNVLTMTEAMIRQERFYMDMLTYSDAVKAFFHRMSDVMSAVADRVCRMDIAALYVMDDIAYNTGLMMSPDHFREIVMPHWKKVIDVGHAHGKPVFFHTDGKVDALWDVFADELRVRMLNPLQPDLQNVGDFKKGYHGRTGIYGGLDTGKIHTMTPEQVRQHVLELFEQAGADGGLIMSTHDIDHSISDETLEAMVTAIKECVY